MLERPIVTRVMVLCAPQQDVVAVWNRGTLAGHLAVGKGEGRAFVKLLMGPLGRLGMRVETSTVATTYTVEGSDA